MLLIRVFKRRRPSNSLDSELRALIEDSRKTEAAAIEIRQYLLDIANDNKQNIEKFSDLRLHQAREMIDRLGPGAFYWMTDIAATLAAGYAARINGIPTNVDDAVTLPTTPEEIIRTVIFVQ